MGVNVTISAYLRRATGGQATVQVSGKTVRGVLDGLVVEFPALCGYLFHPDERGQVRRFMHVYHNGIEVRSAIELARTTNDGDELILVPDVA